MCVGGERGGGGKSVQNEYNIVLIGCKPPPILSSPLQSCGSAEWCTVRTQKNPSSIPNSGGERDNKATPLPPTPTTKKLCLIQTEDKAQNNISKWVCAYYYGDVAKRLLKWIKLFFVAHLCVVRMYHTITNTVLRTYITKHVQDLCVPDSPPPDFKRYITLHT